MNSLLLNLLYSLLLIVSGIVIIYTLDRFKMRVACIAFTVLFVICLIYIPFYFGGNVMLSFFSGLIKDQTVAEIFVASVNETLNAPFLLFQSVSLGMAIFSVICIVACLIATVTLAIKVVNYVRNYLKKKEFCFKRLKQIVLNEVFLYINFRFLYKRLERYRN